GGIVVAVVHFGRVVREIVELSGARAEIERAFVRAGAHGPQLQADAAARGMYVPLAIRDVAPFRLAGEEFPEAPALERLRRGDAREVVERRRKIERGNRLTHDLRGRDAGAARDERNAQQVLVGNRMLEIQAVVAEQLPV